MINLYSISLVVPGSSPFIPHLPGMTFSPREFRFCKRLRLRHPRWSANERKKQMKAGAKSTLENDET